MAKYRETKTEHYYQPAHGMFPVKGYGPSMDPHRCGHPDEPCITVTSEREVTDWEVVSKETKGGFPTKVP